MLDEASVFRRFASSPDDTQLDTTPPLWSLAYHSRPTLQFSESMLQSLLRKAQNANRISGISGLLVVGESDFVQWLEGPQSAVRSLMKQIQADPRHKDVTLLESRAIRQRLFGEWSMLFVDEIQETHFHLPPMLAQSSNLINELKHGSEISDTFTDLSVRASGTRGVIEAATPGHGTARTNAPISGTTGSIDGLLRGRVIPELIKKVKRSNAHEPTLLVTALANVALKQDAKTVTSILRHASFNEGDSINAQVSLLEQTERRLGDMWQEDECSETDIILALIELVKALRAVTAHTVPIRATGDAPPAVLVISQPGELHMLPALLDAEVLHQHGWDTTLDFPSSDDVLNQRVAEDWFDAVDISLSDVFRRKHYLKHVAQTISSIRENSRNKHIAVTIGGRAFRDDVGLLPGTGADRLVASANDIEWTISDALRARRRLSRP